MESDSVERARTVIIGDGLSKEILSGQSRHLSSRHSVGRREIERLVGQGRSFGKGPLPFFLTLALESKGRAKVVLLTRAGEVVGDAEANGTDDLVAPFDEMARRCCVVPCPAGQIPWAGLRAAIQEQTGIDPSSTEGRAAGLRFLVVGCHTEERILALAVFLRMVFHCEEVAVSSHLVGSSTQEAHLAVLRHTLPGLGVKVILDLGDAARFAGIDPSPLAEFRIGPCHIDPQEAREKLTADQRRIIELLCLNWTRTRLRPLAGGFSGSLLFLADGWKGEARTEPMVVKIDGFDQMRRELGGYYLVKDFLGKHVPAFGYPVTQGGQLGVGMELAAMEGRPQTLQDAFEAAQDETGTAQFLRRLDKSLELLADKLYRNTREVGHVVPYRDLGIHTEEQLGFLQSNANIVNGYLQDLAPEQVASDVDQLVSIFRLITRNESGLQSETCLSHGDLNYANIISDQGDNVWFIDWTHCGRHPLELDFAKLENDVKFVMTKSFEIEDLPRLRRFEEFLIEHRLPPDAERLPESLVFAKWDLRFRKILGAVRRIRECCFALKESDDWVAYRVSLLRYASHTLSFDKRRDRGECDVTQLAYSLHSVDQLCFNLVSDLFHLRIRSERPDGYPPRQVLTIDEAPWALECPEYAPPYYVADGVKAGEGRWADPEDFGSLGEVLTKRPARYRDEYGRPLNPRGRTGVGGRGRLGLWGRNLSVAVVITRSEGVAGEVEILLGSVEGQGRLEIPKGFVLPDEEPEVALARVLEAQIGCRPDLQAEVIFEGYTYDPRQTDHAWVVGHCVLMHDDKEVLPNLFQPSAHFEEIRWWPLDAATINRLSSQQAVFVRASVKSLAATQQMESAAAESLLASTG